MFDSNAVPNGDCIFFGGIMKHDAFSAYHPLTNFLFFVGAIGFGVVIQHPAYVIMGCICSAIYHVLLKGQKGFLILTGMLPLVLIISAINPVFNHQGDTVLFYLFDNPYTLEALLYGMITAGMLVNMLLWFSCYSQVLTSDKFVNLFGNLIPALSLLLIMVLRMIPNLMRKAAQILGARKSIGKGSGESSGRKDKIMDGMNILSALTDWALEGGIVTADSMRARGYGTAKRSSFLIYRMTFRDILLIVSMVLLTVCVLMAGGTAAEIIPTLQMEKLTWGFAAYTLFLLVPTLLQIQENLIWHISMRKMS